MSFRRNRFEGRPSGLSAWSHTPLGARGFLRGGLFMLGSAGDPVQYWTGNRFEGDAIPELGPTGGFQDAVNFGDELHTVMSSFGTNRWDGTQWVAYPAVGDGSGSQNRNALGVFDGELIMGGGFADGELRRVARWNGAAWVTMDGGFTNNEALALASFGSTIVAGGSFTAIHNGLATCRGVAQWDGASWSPLGEGFTGSGTEVVALCEIDGTLYAGGTFEASDGVTVNNIARWSGGSWQAMGSGTNSRVAAMTEYQGDLVAVGNFTTAGGVTVNGVALWDGSGWSAFGDGFSGAPLLLPRDVVVLRDRLVVCGILNNGWTVASWDPGTGAWEQMGNGPDGGGLYQVLLADERLAVDYGLQTWMPDE